MDAKIIDPSGLDSMVFGQEIRVLEEFWKYSQGIPVVDSVVKAL